MKEAGTAGRPGEGKGQKRAALAGKYGQAMVLGTNLAVAMAVFTLAGYYIDRKRGGEFFWTLCGMGLGLAYGAWEIWKTIRLLNSADEPSGHSPEGDRNGK